MSDGLLLDIPDVAAELKASKAHVYRLIASGELQTVDISVPGSRKSKTRVSRDDLRAYIVARASGRRHTKGGPHAGATAGGRGTRM